jgi:predicted nucleic acid-binding protein
VKTAVDTSVLLDIFQPDPRFGPPSREALRRAYAQGALVACEIVWAEIRAHFPADELFEEALSTMGIRFEPLSPATVAAAGRLWRESRKAGKVFPVRVVADFLVGAHAQLQAEALLTRDLGFYRRHFQGLKVIDPGAALSA